MSNQFICLQFEFSFDTFIEIKTILTMDFSSTINK